MPKDLFRRLKEGKPTDQRVEKEKNFQTNDQTYETDNKKYTEDKKYYPTYSPYIDLEDIPPAPTGQMFYDIFNWMYSLITELFGSFGIREYFWPIKPEGDIAYVLENNARDKNARYYIEQLAKGRAITVNENFRQDAAKVNQKVQICKDWGEKENAYLKQLKHQVLTIRPPVDVNPRDYKETPGWVVEPGQVNFRGQQELCNDLRCTQSSNNQIMAPSSVTQANVCFSYQNRINRAKIESASCISNIIDLQQQIEFLTRTVAQQNEFIDSSCRQNDQTFFHSNPYNDPSYYQNFYNKHTNSFDQYQYQNQYNPNYYHPQPKLPVLAISDTKDSKVSDGNPTIKTNIPVNIPDNISEPPGSQLVLGLGSSWDKFFNTLIFPVSILRENHPLWGNRPPWQVIRIVSALVFLILWIFIVNIVFKLSNILLSYIPEPDKKEIKKQKKKENKQKKEKSSLKKSAIELLNKSTPDWLYFRGGGVSITATDNFLLFAKDIAQKDGVKMFSIDPVILYLHMEKIRQEIQTPYSNVVKSKIKSKVKIVEKGFTELVESIKKPVYKRPVILQMMLGIMVFGSTKFKTTVEFPISLPESSFETIKCIEPIYNFKQIKPVYSIEIADNSILSVSDNSVLVKKIKKTKTKIYQKSAARKRFKQVGLKDLPPLDFKKFPEEIPKSSNSISKKVAIKVKN